MLLNNDECLLELLRFSREWHNQCESIMLEAWWIASGVIWFKSTVDIRRSDVEAPKADRMMRTQTNWYKHTCAYCIHTRAYMRYACVWYPWANLGLGYSRQIFTSIFRRSLILVLACSRIDSCVLSHELCNLKATSLGIILGIESKRNYNDRLDRTLDGWNLSTRDEWII